jgi:hypothetical protein
LEDTYGIYDPMKEEHLVKSPLLLKWRSDFLKSKWITEDNDPNAMNNLPILDPDIVSSKEVLSPQDPDPNKDWQKKLATNATLVNQIFDMFKRIVNDGDDQAIQKVKNMLKIAYSVPYSKADRKDLINLIKPALTSADFKVLLNENVSSISDYAESIKECFKLYEIGQNNSIEVGWTTLTILPQPTTTLTPVADSSISMDVGQTVVLNGSKSRGPITRHQWISTGTYQVPSQPNPNNWSDQFIATQDMVDKDIRFKLKLSDAQGNFVNAANETTVTVRKDPTNILFPVADTSISMDIGQIIVLNGSKSRGPITRYEWIRVDNSPIPITLQPNPNNWSNQFIATQDMVGKDIRFRLRVFDGQKKIDDRLRQLYIKKMELVFLYNIIKTAESRKLLYPEEWNQVCHLLTQIIKIRILFGIWKKTESDNNLYLSPEIFSFSSVSPTIYPWRYDQDHRIYLENKLSSRIKESLAIQESINSSIQNVESIVLSNLKDSIFSVFTNGKSKSDAMDMLSSYHLLDFNEQSSIYLTRIEQAIFTLQSLYNEIRTN